MSGDGCKSCDDLAARLGRADRLNTNLRAALRETRQRLHSTQRGRSVLRRGLREELAEGMRAAIRDVDPGSDDAVGVVIGLCVALTIVEGTNE